MLKFYRHGRIIYSLDGTAREFRSINQAKAHVRKVIKPAFGEVLSNTPGSIRRERETAWKAARAKHEVEVAAAAKAKAEADAEAAQPLDLL